MYKDIWDNHLGEELACSIDSMENILSMHVGTKGMNIYDLFAIAVLKSDVIVGHIP